MCGERSLFKRHVLCVAQRHEEASNVRQQVRAVCSHTEMALASPSRRAHRACERVLYEQHRWHCLGGGLRVLSRAQPPDRDLLADPRWRKTQRERPVPWPLGRSAPRHDGARVDGRQRRRRLPRVDAARERAAHRLRRAVRRGACSRRRRWRRLIAAQADVASSSGRFFFLGFRSDAGSQPFFRRNTRIFPTLSVTSMCAR